MPWSAAIKVTMGSVTSSLGRVKWLGKEDMLPTLELYVSAWWIYDAFVNISVVYILHMDIENPYFTNFVWLLQSNQITRQGIYDPQV